MNESNRQKATTQPQRPVAGSVPVLFSVRNVQPRIVGAITQPNPSVGPVSDVAPTSLASDATTPALATSVSSPTKTRVPSTNSRVYNTGVGLLVVALCLLVIRNTQGSKSDSKETIASNTAIPVMAIPVEIKPHSNLKVELVPPALPNPTSLGPIEVESPSAPSHASTPNISLVSSSWEVTDAALPEPPLAQSIPPMLLQSKVPSHDSAQEEGFVQPFRSNLGNETVPTGLGFVAPAPPLVDTIPGILDTNFPSMTTRELHEMQTTALIELRKQGKNPATSNSPYGQPYQKQDSGTGVPAMSVSNAASVSNLPTAVPGAAIPSVYKPLYTVEQGAKDPSILAGKTSIRQL